MSIIDRQRCCGTRTSARRVKGRASDCDTDRPRLVVANFVSWRSISLAPRRRDVRYLSLLKRLLRRENKTKMQMPANIFVKNLASESIKLSIFSQVVTDIAC